MFILTPVLGDIRIGERSLHGSGNSTRWIIEVEQKGAQVDAQTLQFLLLRNNIPVTPSIYSFSFGPLDGGMYTARPVLKYSHGGWTLEANPVGAKYLLSIDILHSLYR